MLVIFFTYFFFLKTYEGMIVGEHSRDSDLDVSMLYFGKMKFTLLIFILAISSDFLKITLLTGEPCANKRIDKHPCTGKG